MASKDSTGTGSAGAGMAGAGRTDLILVAGGTTAAAAHGVERVIAAIRAAEPSTAVVHHDLCEAVHGTMWRRLRFDAADHTAMLELSHGGVSTSLREDLLPLLRALGRRREIRRIVAHLDPALDPEQVCWTVLNVVCEGAPVTDTVELRGVITVLDARSWLADATGAEQLGRRGLVRLPEEDRTLAHLVVAQAEFADLLVYAGTADSELLARTDAVLARLAPLAPRLGVAELDHRVLLANLPPDARRGRPRDPHAALLRGQPPLHADGGVQLMVFTARRPFHPGRLHAALDVLLAGVVRARGRLWLATRPDSVLWLESAGSGLQIDHVGDWLAVGDADAWELADPQRRVAAAVRWHERWGDRAQDLSILVHGADPEFIDGALRDALLTGSELAAGEAAWRHYPDPFGWWHTDPCDRTTHAGSGRDGPSIHGLGPHPVEDRPQGHA